VRNFCFRNPCSATDRDRIHRALSHKILQTASLTTTALVTAVTSVSISNSAAGQETSSSTGSAQTVSWQSAFWALVAIAANTCLQESGNICEIDAKFGLLIKSSPIFCAVDAVIACGQIIYYLTKVPPREAIRTVASCRQQHSAGAATESTPLPRVVGRCLLLVLALLQALKLYALRGIPWTQAFGTMYLISYGTNALLNILGKPEPDLYPARPERRGEILPSKRLVHFFAVGAACLQTAMWIVIVGKAVPDKWLASLRLRKCGWLIDLVTLLPFLPVLLYFLILLWHRFHRSFAPIPSTNISDTGDQCSCQCMFAFFIGFGRKFIWLRSADIAYHCGDFGDSNVANCIHLPLRAIAGLAGIARR